MNRLKMNPVLFDQLIALVAKVASKVASIMPDGTVMATDLRSIHADSEVENHSTQRWHRDDPSDYRLIECAGRFNTTLPYIFLATLKGPHTLYCTGSYDSKVKQCIQDSPDTGVVSASLGWGMIHRVGRNVQYHSGPGGKDSRLFLSGIITYAECWNSRYDAYTLS